MTVPGPSIDRLTVLYRTLEDLLGEGERYASSADLGRRAQIPPYTVRKDLSYLENSCGSGSGYDLEALACLIRDSLGFHGECLVCVVGLGHIGSAIMANAEYAQGGYRIAAGFDSNVNLLELMKTDIPLFPAHEIPVRVRELGVGLAVLCVPAHAAQLSAERLAAGGVTGIVNFAPVALRGLPDTVEVRSVSVLDELRILTANRRTIVRTPNR